MTIDLKAIASFPRFHVSKMARTLKTSLGVYVQFFQLAQLASSKLSRVCLWKERKEALVHKACRSEGSPRTGFGGTSARVWDPAGIWHLARVWDKLWFGGRMVLSSSTTEGPCPFSSAANFSLAPAALGPPTVKFYWPICRVSCEWMESSFFTGARQE